MLDFMNKADVAHRIHYAIHAMSADEVRGVDAMKATLLLSGLYVESAFLFDNCEEALQGEPMGGDIDVSVLPPSCIIDFDAEMGRAMAREFFEEWLDCEYEFHNMILTLTHQIFNQWEEFGQSRSESFIS